MTTLISRALMYDNFAALLKYPEADYQDRLVCCEHLLREAFPEIAERLQVFSSFAHECSLDELEEHYTRTFDVNPVCALEVGWHLFGESYARGAFLVQMRQLLRECNIEENGDLPDHLSLLVSALGRIGDAKASELFGKQVAPSIAKMAQGLEAQKNPYASLLRTVAAVLEREHINKG